MPSRAKKHRANAGQSSTSKHERPRLSAYRRGYGRTWRRMRDAQLADEPTCRVCRTNDRVTVATEVDHIIPTAGEDDPRHYDPTNLQSLCKPCHGAKTVRDTKAGATRKR